MIKGYGITIEKFLAYLCVAVGLVAALHYFVLHWNLIWDPMPLAVREAAPIIIAEAYAEQLKEGDFLPYGIESYPQATSVYGPIYMMSAGALQAVMDVNPYTLHRVFVGLAMLISAVLCGLLVWKLASWQAGFLAAVWFYLIQVASMTVAAGPSALAMLFYVLGMAAILQFGSGRLGLFLAIAAGFLGLLTKPYFSLIIPAVLIYTYLFQSPRRALIAAGATACATLVLFLLASVFLPTYLHSVYQIHSAYATRVFDNLLSQTLAFSKLNFGLLLAFLLAFPLSGFALRSRSLKSLWGPEPLIGPDIQFDRLLVLLASAALLVSLGWHGGAYLIYYNHLLLPPLLVAAFRFETGLSRKVPLPLIVLILNAASLIVWRPPLRLESQTHLQVMSQLMGKSALVDPVLEPLARLFRKVECIDNGQSEYLVYYDKHHDGEFSRVSLEWEKQLSEKIHSGKYESLLLSAQFNREPLIFHGKISNEIYSNYVKTSSVKIPIYFLHFKDWSKFGGGEAEVYLFQKRDKLVKESSTN